MKRILVIDDDDSSRESISSYLSECGYEVTTANDGYEGLELIRKSPPDLIISDNIMPKLYGVELAAVINAFKEKIPIIIISAYNNFKKIAEDLNVFAFFLKPIDIHELKKKIGELNNE